MKRLAFALAFAAATPAFASDAWNVVEGPQGAVKGTWNIMANGPNLTGAATMTGPEGQVRYNVVGRLQNGIYTLRRMAASDRRDCEYHGAMKGDAIVGSAVCGARQGPWIVHPVKK